MIDANESIPRVRSNECAPFGTKNESVPGVVEGDDRLCVVVVINSDPFPDRNGNRYTADGLEPFPEGWGNEFDSLPCCQG